MEETPEGLAIAAATREAAKRKRAPDDQTKLESVGVKPVKKIARPPPTATHDVALPSDYDEQKISLDPVLHGTIHDPQWSGAMAKSYPFTLDPFQQIAIACLERCESVMVAAHTSAGKTAVAEYAIAMSFRDKQRVIYTSPLKALSNQKFRELSEEFSDVGLMTGDVSINPNAACIVMTTEILRSMIYRGSELLREVAWVVFDEVHYMQDRERGVVWEETIIFLPRQTKMVFLSATLSNSKEFCEWVCHLHHQPCHVVFTDFRPTPLQHYAFPTGGQGLFLILDERGDFKENNFLKMRQSITGRKDQDVNDVNGADKAAAPDPPPRGGPGGRYNSGGRGSGRGRGRGGRGGFSGGGKQDVTNDMVKIVKVVKERELDPVIVFSFSRRECEAYARVVSEKLDFNTDEEKEEVAEVFNNAIQCLSEEDRKLPFLEKMLPMLQRGVAMHHSGLLPILKELIELLFSEQLIKALFATETFAMGVNMPARTVVFTAMQKWDGEAFRWMGSGEYIQMSGRAGRRGKDDRGMCIMMVDDKMDTETCRSIVQGKPSPLNSSFKLSYYTLLNLLKRMEGSGGTVEYVIQHSFNQFQWERQLPKMESELKFIEEELATMTTVPDAAIEEYNALRTEIALHEKTLLNAMLQPDRVLTFLRPGRLVKIKERDVEWGWGAVVGVQQSSSNRGSGGGRGGRRGHLPPDFPAANYTMDVLLKCAPNNGGGKPQPALNSEDGEMHVLPVPLPLITNISTLRISIPENLQPLDARKATFITVKELEKRFNGNLPNLDPIEDVGLDDPEALLAVKKMQEAEAKLLENEYHKTMQEQGELLSMFKRKAELLARSDKLKSDMKDSQLATFRSEAKSRTAVLKKLGHINEEGVVGLKGRAACEIDTADELLTTEMMFNGVFNSLDKHQLVALVSCLVSVEKSKERIKLKDDLADPLRQLQNTAREIAEVSAACKLDVKEDDYVESFKPFLMDVIFAWSKGAKFGDICEMTDLFEGSIIRATRRLDELMHQLERAAKTVGDEELAAKFAESVQTIRRDIIFAASLYI